MKIKVHPTKVNEVKEFFNSISNKKQNRHDKIMAKWEKKYKDSGSEKSFGDWVKIFIDENKPKPAPSISNSKTY